MRYFVRAFVTHETEQNAAQQAVQDNLFQNPEQLEGFVQGYSDEKGVQELAARGFTMSVEPAEPDDAVIENPSPFALRTFSMRAGNAIKSAGAMPATRRADGRTEYFLLRIPGGLTPQRKNSLADAAITIVERDHGDWYVAKLPDREAPFALEFVREARHYGVDETVASPSSTLGIDPATGALTIPEGEISRAALYDVTLHPDADVEGFVQEVAQIGGRVLSRSDRTMRIVPGRARPVDLADLPEVAQLEPVRAPRLLDDFARRIIGLEDPSAALLRTVDLDGAGELIGVADTGLDETHPDFTGRIVATIARGRTDDASDPDGHGTHVAGTILGDGQASGGTVAGVAPAAQLFFQSVMDANGRLGGLPSDIRLLFQEAYDAGVRVHNNSWGAYLYSRYGANSLQTDAFVHAHPDFLPVIAAGNEGSCLPGMSGRPNGFVDFPSLSAPATSKNGLTVGASRSARTRGGYAQLTWGALWNRDFPTPPMSTAMVSGDPEALAGFSSRGPCDFGAIKPDLTAPGTDIAAPRSSTAPLRNFWGAYPGNPRYAFMGGTSMASPIVAGAAALVRQYYRQRRGHTPSAALMKATLINGTAKMSGVDANSEPKGFPNFDQGFGRLDLAGSLPSASRPDMRLEFLDCPSSTPRVFTSQGQRFQWDLELDGDGELRLCLAWTDPPARALQNSIRILLDQGAHGMKHSSNSEAATLLTLAEPTAFGGLAKLTRRDASNNVHILRLPAATRGIYRLTLVADFMTTDSQTWAMVVTGPVQHLRVRGGI